MPDNPLPSIPEVEAVSSHIRADVARTAEEREEILSEWKQTQKEPAKDARNADDAPENPELPWASRYSSLSEKPTMGG
jgi:hypothetical protein